MRLLPDDSVRKPDPAPVQTDNRIPMLVGTAAWLLALVALLLLPGARASSPEFWFWTCLVGIGLGFIGLVYTHVTRIRR